MKNPFPAYQWYARDYLSSSAHATMTLEEQGAYRNLLDRAWIDDPPCSLPDDDAQLALLSGAGAKWPEMTEKLRQWFVPRRGRLWNAKLLQNFREMQRIREARSQAGIIAGRKSAELRAKTGNQTLTTEQPKSNPASSSASSSSEDSLRAPRALNGDLVKSLFDAGVSLLTRHGVTERDARSLVGRLRKTHRDEHAHALLLKAASMTDPKEWLAATLKAPSERPYSPC